MQLTGRCRFLNGSVWGGRGAEGFIVNSQPTSGERAQLSSER